MTAAGPISMRGCGPAAVLGPLLENFDKWHKKMPQAFEESTG